MTSASDPYPFAPPGWDGKAGLSNILRSEYGTFHDSHDNTLPPPCRCGRDRPTHMCHAGVYTCENPGKPRWASRGSAHSSTYQTWACDEHWEIYKQLTGNARFPREGYDFCRCGSKYWDGLRCHSCGEDWDGEGEPR